MKEMSKARIISKRSVHSVMGERNILASIYSDFIVNIHYAFQDRDNLYLALGLKEGGDLRFHFSRIRYFT